MENPSLVQDKFDRIWQYDCWEQSYKCLSRSNLRMQSLKELMDKVSPIHVLDKGDRITLPYEPIANDTWVEFDNEFPATVTGRVHNYDDGKLFYEVIVLVGRDGVKEIS